MSEKTAQQLQDEIDALQREIERAEDAGITVMPERRARLAGLTKLLEARKRHDAATER